MKCSFKAFLGENSITNASEWDNSSVEKLEVFREARVWRLYIKVDHIIPARVIQESETQLGLKCRFLNTVEILPIPPNLPAYLTAVFNNRKSDLDALIFDGEKLIQLKDNISWNLKNSRLDLVAGDPESYNMVLDNELCNRLSDWLWKEYRLRIVVRARCNSDTIPLSCAEEEHYITRRNVNIIENTEPSKKPNSYNRRERSKSVSAVIDGEPMPIAEIQEGLRTVIVEGDVWARELTTLKDGRFVAVTYLTDYTDSILIKSFLDHPEDEPINTGDHIKVKGSVRYDNFARELVLFREAYSLTDKEERTDESPEKRIELHAHTKMSAMDGLTEIDDLISTAARWGHPAIAITDHGCIQAFPPACTSARKHGIKVIYGVEGYLVEENKKEKPYHIILLTKNNQGMHNLYRLISDSYLNNFYRTPKMTRQQLAKHREGLLVGSACEAGELYRAILNGATDEQLESMAEFYDYLEIQPIPNNQFMLKEGLVDSEEQLMNNNRRIVELGKKLGKLVVATGDVHFLEPHDEIFRRIVQAGQGYEDAEIQAPLYFRTTSEMLDEFTYLGEEQANAVVIKNPAAICAQIEDLQPVPDGFYPPKIASAESEITSLAWKQAHHLYGSNLPEIVQQRLEKELDAITRHGFSVLYLIAHKLVKKSNEDGYLVGSRGSVGSSLVAHFTGITEVNPLPPHYICPQCGYSDFITDGSVGSGVDLPDKLCPTCQRPLKKGGFDIPFETFLGFKGDKIPDIDLNFSGDYQSRAHKYVEELFGSKNVFRAGTISTIAEKTAYGFVKKYAEGKQVEIKNSEATRLARGITGVRRTTGQHPGGLIVVPTDSDILDFTPLQYPADNKNSGVITTHFEYHAIGDQLVKLDILGHDDPTVIKELEDLTGVKASAISLSDSETMKLFSSVEPLKVDKETIDSDVGTYGIPEFGTRFVRQMLEVTRPTTFSELVRISGLSHGTNVWLNNAQDLIENDTATLDQVICTRDDIMTYLIHKNMEKQKAFKIMEKVRKGKGLVDEDINVMHQCDIPDWYIDSCKKIKYMFPKAHAVAYVTMAFRIAYYKINYPLQFYASFFGIRAEDFDAETILAGYEAVHKRIKDIDKQGHSALAKDRKMIIVLELAMEMYARGFQFYPVDIYGSDASRFTVANDGLVLPFAALPNVGVNAAVGIVQARDNGDFVSIEDFQARTGLNKTAMDILRQNGCFKNMPESNQISLFG
ncbi:MAG TPA: PolC-type DNA polymerase III [Syntrophomonadaceae bacterium]|nr:PolC-type DNA polymerase III [Syntrophomonadaceae bacterium]